MATDSIPRLQCCTKCGKELPYTNEYFHPFYRGGDRLRYQCKACTARIKRAARIAKRKNAGKPMWRMTPEYRSEIASDGQDVLEIALTKGYSTVVDPVDTDLAEQLWHVTDTRYPYAVKKVGKYKKVKMHRVIMERIIGRCLEHGEEVDHIDGNPLNNRRGNLRLASHQENSRNRAVQFCAKSGLLGVKWVPESNKWRAVLLGKSLGNYDDAEEAHAVYLAAAKLAYGDFAPVSRRPLYPITKRKRPITPQGVTR